MNIKAQSSLEFLMIVIIMVLLLFLGIMILSQQSSISNFILNVNYDIRECNRISNAVSEIYASSDIAQKTIYLTRPIDVNKTALEKTGRIHIGNAECGYFGTAAIEISPGSYSEDYETHPVQGGRGFTLLQGEHIIKKEEGMAVFVDQETRT